MNTNTTTAGTDAVQSAILRWRRETEHGGCALCSRSNAQSLRLICHPISQGRVAAVYEPEPWMVGYDGQMHGGLVSALLDSAMTQCLFAQDLAGVTAVMHTRFRKPAPLDRPLFITAWVERSDGRRHRLRAQLAVNNGTVAEAEAVFVTRP